MDEPVDRASVILAARATVAAHDDGRGCPRCTPDGCRQEAWARRELERLCPA